MRVKTPITERIMKRIQINSDGCWIWTGSVKPAGYGQVRLGAKTLYTHRVIYEHHNGPIPDGLVIDHLCRNRRCCNPTHLEAVTQRENFHRGEGMLNGAKIQKAKTHCPHGHSYSGDNLGVKSNGHRYCKACARKYEARRNRRQKS